MFNQKRGSLFKLMQAMRLKNREKFDRIVGPHLGKIRQAELFMGMDLNIPDIKTRILELCRDEEFQGVQRRIAKLTYLDPSTEFLKIFGLRSIKARAMGFDISVQYGVGGFKRKLRQAVPTLAHDERAILKRLAKLSDTHSYDNNRRTRILKDDALPFGS